MRPFKKPVRTKISILVPFQSEDAWRLSTWYWVQRYLKDALPEAEIIIGVDPESKKKRRKSKQKPFSKTTAVNRAFKKSHGDVIVILDADAYIDTEVIKHCAERIRAARAIGSKLWFVPYLWIYRLTKDSTMEVLNSKPKDPHIFSDPPADNEVEGTDGSGWGRKFGALVQIMPREAFELVGGMDQRFRGWGGEDVSFLKALDTLWAKHSNTPNNVLHLWHTKILANDWRDGEGNNSQVRAWENQNTEVESNDWLSTQYSKANGNIDKMKTLINERKPQTWQTKILRGK